MKSMDDNAISVELEELYMLQNKPVPQGKVIALFLRELNARGFSTEAVKNGLKTLRDRELAYIRLNTIIDAVMPFHGQEMRTISNVRCIYCNGTGLVSMIMLPNDILAKSKNFPYEFVFSCTCIAGGQRYQTQQIPKWNGKYTQLHYNVTYRLAECHCNATGDDKR